MRMLARAQSLSGRPLDALVMLERLLALGVTTDAATNDDFRRVRALPAWPEFEQRSAASPAAAPSAIVPVARRPTPQAHHGRARGLARRRRRRREGQRRRRPERLTLRRRATPARRCASRRSRSFRPASPTIASRTASSSATSTSASSRSWTRRRSGWRTWPVRNRRGSDSIAALEIDAREGDLWVVSSPVSADAAPVADGAAAPSAILHKLQLISGRVLYAVALEPSFGVARFTDVAITPHSTVLVLDAAGRRVFVTPARGRRLDLALQLDVAAPSSLAPESDSVVYVAHADGVLRADLDARKARAVSAPSGVSLSGLTRLRWHRGALLGVQTSEDGLHRIVRLKLDGSGLRVTGVDVLDCALQMPDPTAASLAGDVFLLPCRSRAGARRSAVRNHRPPGDRQVVQASGSSGAPAIAVRAASSTAAGAHPSARRSATPVSPSDLLNFCVGDFITSEWCRSAAGAAARAAAPGGAAARWTRASPTPRMTRSTSCSQSSTVTANW